MIAKLIRNHRRRQFHKKVKKLIEDKFPGVIVRHTHSGCHECGGDNGEETFEAYMVPENKWREFHDFTHAVHKQFRSSPFIPMIHDLSPQETYDYRREWFKE